MDRAIVGTATSALPLLFSDPQRWPIGDLGSCAVRIALEPERAGPSLSRLLGDPSDRAWRVIVGECGKFSAHCTDDRLRGLADLLDTPLVDVQGDEFVAIVAANADADELRKRLDKAKTICGVSSAMPWWWARRRVKPSRGTDTHRDGRDVNSRDAGRPPRCRRPPAGWLRRGRAAGDEGGSGMRTSS
jgi:hypothetical protein